MAPMSTAPDPPTRSPPPSRLLVDGTNLLHAMSQVAGRGAGGRRSIGRLRGAVPPSVAIDVVFDGPAERGLRGERIASGLRVRYSGGRDRRRRAPVAGRRGPRRSTARPRPRRSSSSPTTATCATAARSRARGRPGAAWLLGRLDRVGSGRATGRRPATGDAGRPSRGRRPATTDRPSDDDRDDRPAGNRAAARPSRRATRARRPVGRRD